MLILLSPAKNLNFAQSSQATPRSQPLFPEKTLRLVKAARKLSADDLAKLMDISPKLAALNAQRFADFAVAPSEDRTKQAALAFDGDVYRGLNAATLSLEDLEWAQDRVRILSGLYGLLRPLDSIQPYRLEMGIRFSVGKANSLYQFWGETITSALGREAGGEPVINLASDEYATAIDRTHLQAPIIDVAFKEVRDGKARPIFMYVKRARGLMTRYAIERRIENAAGLRAFNVDGYRLDSEASSSTNWVFTRPQPEPKSA